ncbi:MAG: zf-HC2 domain-containing protein [Gammaproteobacteria bacterium]|nr:zf-HC2 domain-containing protein [Gammaproteobacteria bacterium]
MTCRRIESQLDDYLDGELDADAAASLERHARQCGRCGQVLADAKALGRTLAALPVEAPSAGFFDEALATAARPAAAKPKATRRWYVGAIAAGIAVAAFVGLIVNDIDPAREPAGIADVALSVHETRTIHLVFASEQALDDVSLTVELPAGVELASYPGQQRVRWSTALVAGNNVLPLELIAIGGDGGELVATMQQSEQQKVFRVNIAVLMV